MIAAIILAAGQSRRMGQPKMVLPWGKLTVIEHVITVFQRAGIEDILVVTGADREQVEHALEPYTIRFVHNQEYRYGEMLSSLQHGLRGMKPEAEATLIGLGDQPQVQESTVRLVMGAHLQNRTGLVVPSFQKRRGHPWLAARSLWGELLSMSPPASLRDFLNQHSAEIDYVNLDTSSILADLDTPHDYERFRPLQD